MNGVLVKGEILPQTHACKSKNRNKRERGCGETFFRDDIIKVTVTVSKSTLTVQRPHPKGRKNQRLFLGCGQGENTEKRRVSREDGGRPVSRLFWERKQEMKNQISFLKRGTAKDSRGHG